MKRMFVGGPWDGVEREVHSQGTVIRVPVMIDETVAALMERIDGLPPIEAAPQFDSAIYDYCPLCKRFIYREKPTTGTLIACAECGPQMEKIMSGHMSPPSEYAPADVVDQHDETNRRTANCMLCGKPVEGRVLIAGHVHKGRELVRASWCWRCDRVCQTLERVGREVSKVVHPKCRHQGQGCFGEWTGEDGLA